MDLAFFALGCAAILGLFGLYWYLSRPPKKSTPWHAPIANLPEGRQYTGPMSTAEIVQTMKEASGVPGESEFIVNARLRAILAKKEADEQKKRHLKVV